MLKYILLRHLQQHHGLEPADFTHQVSDVECCVANHPEISKKLEKLLEKLCEDLERIREECEEEHL